MNGIKKILRKIVCYVKRKEDSEKDCLLCERYKEDADNKLNIIINKQQEREIDLLYCEKYSEKFKTVVSRHLSWLISSACASDKETVINNSIEFCECLEKRLEVFSDRFEKTHKDNFVGDGLESSKEEKNKKESCLE